MIDFLLKKRLALASFKCGLLAHSGNILDFSFERGRGLAVAVISGPSQGVGTR